MKFPKIKNALLCRILMYVIVLGGFAAPVVIVAMLPFVPTDVKGFFGMGVGICLIVYLFKNFMVLFPLDMALACLYGNLKAREFFTLRKNFSVEKTEKRLSRFGTAYDPTALSPRPHMVRYRSESSMTVYAKAIEKVVVTYHTDLLTKEQYQLFFASGTTNGKALYGKKKHFIIDKTKKKAELNCVTVILIFAKAVEKGFREELYKRICQQSGDGFETSTLPCVVDLEKGICTFDSDRIPYMGFQYAVKNRGIKLIRKYLFGSRFPYRNSPKHIEPIKDTEDFETLWDLCRFFRKEMVLQEKEMKKRFQKMIHKEVVSEGEFVYVKWQERGIWLAVEQKEDCKTVEIDPIEHWTYPKTNKIAKATENEMKSLIMTHYRNMGYTAKFRPKD